MSKNGSDIVTAIRELRGFHSDVALLLQSASMLLEEDGFSPYSNQAVVSTNGVSNPQGWMPHYAFQYYEHSQHSHRLVFVSVILDDLKTPGLVDQPYVSSGFIDFDKPVYRNRDTAWDWGYAAVAGSAKEVARDGNLYELPVQSLHEMNPKKVDAKGGKVLAVPLVAITDVEALAERVIEPLLKAVEEEKA